MKLPKIVNNAPVIVWFTVVSFLVLLFGYATGGESTASVFTCYRSEPSDPLMYLRMVTYVLGHKDVSHFVGNFTIIALVGPMLEEKYGAKRLLLMMLATAFIGGVANVLLTTSGLLGASGIVFLFIILASCTTVGADAIPVTLVLVTAIYIGQEVLTGITADDTISQLTHILGGICGVIFGLYYNKKDAEAKKKAEPKKEEPKKE